MISIIPFLYNPKVIIQSIIIQHGPDFNIGKAKVFIKKNIGDRHNFKVIQPGENTLLCNAQTSRQDGKINIIICLQRLPEQISDQGGHFVIIAILLCLVQWNVILVDEQDHFLPVMFT